MSAKNIYSVRWIYLFCLKTTYHQSAPDGRRISVHIATEARSPAPRRLITRFFFTTGKSRIRQTLDKKELSTNRRRPKATNNRAALHSVRFRFELRRWTERGFERGRFPNVAWTSLGANDYRHASMAGKLCISTRVVLHTRFNLQRFFMAVHRNWHHW